MKDHHVLVKMGKNNSLLRSKGLSSRPSQTLSRLSSHKLSRLSSQKLIPLTDVDLFDSEKLHLDCFFAG